MNEKKQANENSFMDTKRNTITNKELIFDNSLLFPSQSLKWTKFVPVHTETRPKNHIFQQHTTKWPNSVEGCEWGASEPWGFCYLSNSNLGTFCQNRESSCIYINRNKSKKKKEKQKKVNKIFICPPQKKKATCRYLGKDEGCWEESLLPGGKEDLSSTWHLHIPLVVIVVVVVIVINVKKRNKSFLHTSPGNKPFIANMTRATSINPLPFQ